MNKMMIGFFLVTMLPIVQAAEMDHGHMGHSKADHAKMNHEKMMQDNKSATSGLEMLAAMPASGKAREAGADERYMMESISVDESLADKCAKASRGLMMLDNATWEKCGGKPEGAAISSAAIMAEKSANEHAGHDMP